MASSRSNRDSTEDDLLESLDVLALEYARRIRERYRSVDAGRKRLQDDLESDDKIVVKQTMSDTSQGGNDTDPVNSSDVDSDDARVKPVDSDRTSAAVSWTSSSQSFGFVPVPLKKEERRRKQELKPIAAKRLSFHGPPSPSAPAFTFDASLSSDFSLELPDVSASADVSVDGPGEARYSHEFSVDVDVPVPKAGVNVDVKFPAAREDLDVSLSGSAAAQGKLSVQKKVGFSAGVRINTSGSGDATAGWPFGENDERPPTADSLNAQLAKYVRERRRVEAIRNGSYDGDERLYHRETNFDTFTVTVQDYEPPLDYETLPSDDEELAQLEDCHRTVHSFEYVDTFFELSGSRGFGWLYYYRWPDPAIVFFFNFCGLYLLDLVSKTLETLDVRAQAGYVKLGNYFWWTGLKWISSVFIVQSFGVAPWILDFWSRRIYFFALFTALCGLTVAYLQMNNCISWCPWLCWATLTGTMHSAAAGHLGKLYRFIGWRISDTLFFVYFLLLMVQAACADHEDMKNAIVWLGVSFGYAGPLGCWSPIDCFRVRVALMTYALTKAIPILQLPAGKECSLSTCFDELLNLFAEDLCTEAGFTSGTNDDWGVFWLLILFLLFALFWLCQPDGMPSPEEPCARRSMKRRPCAEAGRGDGHHVGHDHEKTCFRKSAPNILSVKDCKSLC